MTYETKDSGSRAEYASGMVRDTEAGKARFDLLFPIGVPYAAQMMTRFADLMARGAEKYEARNWEKAKGKEELDRYRSSALRHLVQWAAGETDEDHAAAVMFNLMAGETVKWKMANPRPIDIVNLAGQGRFCDDCFAAKTCRFHPGGCKAAGYTWRWRRFVWAPTEPEMC
jgi:hypothetical protein